MQRSFLFIIFLSTLIVSISFSTVAQTQLKMAYVLPSNSHYGAGAAALSKALERLNNGKFQVRQFANSILGSEKEVIQSLQTGSIDLAIVSTSETMGFVPETGIFDIPFLLRDLQHARNVLDGPIGQNILSKFSPLGLIALAWGEQGFRHLTNNVRPIKEPTDAANLRIRTTDNPVHIEAFRQIGITSIPMPWSDALISLKNGTIDGQENSLSVIISAQLSDTQKYLALTGHVYAPALILVSGKLYNSLSLEEKLIFNRAGQEASLSMRQFVDECEKNGIEQLKKEGMQIIEVDRSAFAAAINPAYIEYYKKFDKRLIDAIPFQIHFQ